MRQLKGIITALITPFVDGGLDEWGLRELIRIQIGAGVNGILLLGTTAETPTLSDKEKRRVMEIGLEEAHGKILVTVGTGTNSTHSTVKMTRVAKEMGVDGAFVVTPYYNCPTDEGIYRHFSEVNKVSLPLIIYNIPKRTGKNISPILVKQLAALDFVCAVKECGENFSQLMEMIEILPILTGDDGLALPTLAMGGVGVVSVIANLFPEKMVAIFQEIVSNNLEKARQLHYQMRPLLQAIFLEINPIGIKAAMQICGLPAGNCRLPLCSMSEKNLSRLQEVLTCEIPTLIG